MNKPDFVPDRPVAFNREFVDLGAGIIGALVLSQAVYWSKRTNDKYGWFYKTAEEWKDEIGVTRWELETARKRLVDAGILDYKKKGVPCKSHYRVKAKELYKRLYCIDNSQFAVKPHTGMLENHILVCSNPTNLLAEIPQTNTETTHRILTENSRRDFTPAFSSEVDFDPTTGEIYSLGGVA